MKINHFSLPNIEEEEGKTKKSFGAEIEIDKTKFNHVIMLLHYCLTLGVLYRVGLLMC